MILQYTNVEITRAERVVLEGVTFSLAKGEFVYLVGQVGSGKSSLMKTIYAEVPIDKADQARILDYDLLRLRRKQIPMLRRNVGIVFQDFQLLTDRSAAANLDFVLRATGMGSAQDRRERIEEVLEAVGMPNKGYKMPHELSGGEQQRIVIARALLNRPALIIADEPTGNLDPVTGAGIVELLHSLTERGQSVLMATHNLQLTDDYPARILQCRDRHLRERT